MFIYLQKSQKENPITSHMISKFPNAKVLEIDHYKNIFDKNIVANINESFVIGEVNNAILEAPSGYGHP
jgi:trans-aconitate methyltransferase